MQTCSKCGQHKRLDEFHRRSRQSDKRRTQCKECDKTYINKWRNANHDEYLAYKREWSRSHIHSLYGLSADELAALVEQSEGRCAICQREQRLNVDHDHETGKVRGLLCHRCNTGLGALGDNIAGLERALEYLKLCDASGGREVSYKHS